ncbi:MAG: hypothetical protein CMK32_09710 [Porticoccaceae bacterium]|nr:hypothetical protein [Porticoccaceae bacterium]|tara:strand:+ start:1144 stop:1779 length:636 start_codon:yes stop_codon:yes gene_type:complete
MFCLVYDTETTGRPADYKLSGREVANWPHVVQLGWALVDLEAGRVVKQQCGLLALDGDAVMEPKAEEIHGISADYARRTGQDRDTVLAAFERDMTVSRLAVCHNVGFDRPVMVAAALRDNCEGLADLLEGVPHYCTMLAGVNICRIPSARGFKWPKLQELHEELLGEGFSGAHDALADVMACSRCLLRLHEACAGELPPEGHVGSLLLPGG